MERFKNLRGTLSRYLDALHAPLAVVFLFAAMVAAAHSVPGPFPTWLGWTSGDAAAACAGFGTVAAIFLGLQQFAVQGRTARSERALDLAMQGVRQAHDVLRGDFPSRNIAWVNAARLILRSLESAKAIDDSAHRAVWDLFREEWRIRFFGLLRASTDYFCGVGEWSRQPEAVEIDSQYAERIARASFRAAEFTSENIGATSYTNTLVSERAIKVIYDFTEYDSDWSDPITDRVGFSESVSHAMFQRHLMGLWGYLELRRKYVLTAEGATRREGQRVT